jgi:hypothetical protein
VKPPVPPRIFCILTRTAPVVAVLRWGPSKKVAQPERNLATDTVTLGQWLRGRIYNRRCDLSPDGRHLIFFAMNGYWDKPLGGSWTAVSLIPDLRALHLFGWAHCWNGGGLFVDNTRYWLNGTPGATWFASREIKPVQRPPDGVVNMIGEDPVTYLSRLARNSWIEARRGLGVDLDMGSGWPEVYASELILAHGGGLWRQKVHGDGPADARYVADLTDMTFKALAAPNPGVQISPAGPRA